MPNCLRADFSGEYVASSSGFDDTARTGMLPPIRIIFRFPSSFLDFYAGMIKECWASAPEEAIFLGLMALRKGDSAIFLE